MKSSTKILFIAAMVVAAVVDFCVFRSNDLSRQAGEAADPAVNIQLLQKASEIFPWNDVIYYEMGKSRLKLGMKELSQGGEVSPLVKESVEDLERSLELNPASPFGHFYFAQALQYDDLLALPEEQDRILAAFQNAAKLAGENREILFEVGRRLMAHWPVLKEEEREFLKNILAKALQWKPLEKFPVLLQLWHLNIGEVGFVESFMPEDPRLYRMFGNFLGEKSMCLEDRHRTLSLADKLELDRQTNLLASADRELAREHWGEAKQFYRWCLGNLSKIRFFYKVAGVHPLDETRFKHVYGLANLGLAQGMSDSGARYDDVREYLMAFLASDPDGDSLKKLDSFLTRKKARDPDIQFLLYSRQGRYRDIVDKAENMDPKNLPAKSLALVGDAYEKTGKPREAHVYFQRSLEKAPKNLEILLLAKKFYENINNRDEILKINAIIKNTIVSGERNFSDLVIEKRREYSWELPFEGKEIRMDLYFHRIHADRAPLVTVEFNMEVVWDKFLEEDQLSIVVNTIGGSNRLTIWAVDQPVILQKASFSHR